MNFCDSSSQHDFGEQRLSAGYHTHMVMVPRVGTNRGTNPDQYFRSFHAKQEEKWLIIDSTANKPFFNWSIYKKCKKKLFSEVKIEMLKIFKISDQEFHKFR